MGKLVTKGAAELELEAEKNEIIHHIQECYKKI